MLTHWGRVTHICVSKLTIISSDNGLSPGRCQAIIWTNAGILLIGTLGTNVSDILSQIHIFLFRKMHFKRFLTAWWAFCLRLNELNLGRPRAHGIDFKSKEDKFFSFGVAKIWTRTSHELSFQQTECLLTNSMSYPRSSVNTLSPRQNIFKRIFLHWIYEFWLQFIEVCSQVSN